MRATTRRQRCHQARSRRPGPTLRIEADRFAALLEQLDHLALGDVQGLRQLGEGRRPAGLALDLPLGAQQPPYLVAGMDREAYRPAGVVDPPADRLLDPPGGVRRELEALSPVELAHGVDQAEVALLDEIEKGQVRGLVPLGDRDHETQVGVDELLARGFARAATAARSWRLRAAFSVAMGELLLGFPALVDDA